jgi:ABC-type dipeptide/oligopeptide/nickel transport system ATPase component
MSALLSIRDLTIDFETETGPLPGVQGIHLEVNRGEIVALVGESGSGKSITSLSILQLLPMPPANVRSGQILFTTREGVRRSSDCSKKSVCRTLRTSIPGTHISSAAVRNNG